jgi:glycosyltransferase involved in cell wall biosynthesis/ubiquinone/menaquinone biosynthesis C-methylase UbiE
MPNYNDGKTIESAIESILDQDYPNVEVVVCDDGSTDNSLETLRNLKEKHGDKMKLLESRHKGACFARNLAARESRGKYLSFLPADAILYPGVIRTWISHLEDNPDYEFLYGGYRFVEEETRKTVFNYMSESFDVYFLKQRNYIDGSFPLTKDLFDRMGGWDVSIKSLQDWDFWLNATIKCGAKGMYLPEIFFETTLPHAGGLSDDSHKNWLERTNFIKEKYEIKNNEICVTSKGAEFHGKKVAKLLNADYQFAPEYKPHRYNMMYLLGFYPSLADQCGAVFSNCRGLRIVHWIGSDVWQVDNQSNYTKRLLLDWLKNNIDVHLCEFKGTQKELADNGIKARIVPIPPTAIYPITELPKENAVAIYSPYVNKNFYYPAIIEELAKKCPDTKFLVFGDHMQVGTKDNISYLGRLDEKETESLINRSKALLRILVHDGLSINVEEFLCAGRRVITNIKYIKFAKTVSLDIDEIVKEIEALKDFNKPDTHAAKYWRLKLSKKKYKKIFEDLLKYDPKDYWEMRAPYWDKNEGTVVLDEEAVMKEVKELNPENILDIGCGNGNWSNKFDKEYLGVDISEKMIKFAKKHNPDKQYRVGDVRELSKIVDKKYDLAFAYTCFLHVPPENIEDAFKEVKKVAKRLLIIEPFKDAPTGQVRFLSDAGIDAIKNGDLIFHPKSTYIHDYHKYLNIVKEIDLGGRKLIIANL